MRRPAKGEWEVHVGVGQQAELFELVAGEEVGFVEGEDDGGAAFVFFGGEQLDGLGDEERLCGSGVRRPGR